MLERLSLVFESWVRKHMPDPFVLVLLLTLLTFGLAFPLKPDPDALASAWLDGFWKLLSFAMQMVLIVVTGEAIVTTRAVHRAYSWLATRPKSPRAALWMLATFALATGWLHWGFGLIGSALLAREMARELERRKIVVDYPLLGTAAYMAMLLWHAGTTASAPLLINTKGHFLEDKIGLVPLSETVFLPSNLAVCALLLVAVPLILTRMHPKKPRPARDYLELAPRATESDEPARTPAERLDRSPWIGRAVGALGMATLALFWAREGFDLNHNIVNFLLLSIGLFLHGSPVRYARAVADSVRGTSGIVLQFPFYGGIMGLMEKSGLGDAIAHRFVAVATATTLPFFAYLASVLTKLFVPSGGGEWAVEGPVMLVAAKAIGAPVGLTTMGVAYGNMVGNLFQPFWAIPLLAVLGLRARDIMGYCFVLFLFAFPILGAALLLAN
jgi:short-chain fatty acids transporter